MERAGSWKSTDNFAGDADVPSSFVGRHQELADIKKLLSTSRLVTLVGAGGVGKTRLALRASHQLQKAFTDGVYVAQLAELTGPELLPQAVLQAVGLYRSPAGHAMEVLADFFQEKQILLVLDNCEHVVDPCAAFAETLLRSTPKLRILATSREAFKVGAEQIYMVPPLSLPDPSEPISVKTHCRYEALALFTDRARAVLPTFVVTDDNKHVLANVCQRLDGVPLAIELAAARMRVLSLEQIHARLDNQPDLLTRGGRTALPRHQTLRATLDWSYDLCSPYERLLWSRLSIFARGFDLDAADSVCTDDGLPADVLYPSLEALMDKSIITRDNCTTRVRYRLLEPVRQYGWQRLVLRDEEPTLRRRHRDHYLRMVTRADDEWFGPEQITWSERIREALPNIRIALEFCLSEPGEARTGLRMAAALWFHWIAGEYPREGRHWLDRALNADQQASRDRARALWVNGYIATRQGQLESALSMLDESRRLAEKNGDQDLLATALQVAGVAELFRDNASRASSLLQQAVTHHAITGTCTALTPLAMTQLSMAATLSGETDRAIELCKQAMDRCTAQNERWVRSSALWNMGMAYRRAGQLPQADQAAREALRIKHELRDFFGMALVIELLAWIAAAAGNKERAATLLGASGAFWDPIDMFLYGARTYLILHHKFESQARHALGDRAFRIHANQGERLDLDEVVAYACDDNFNLTPRSTPQPEPLSPREQEVADLIAQGLTNKHIASNLVISQRTADSHVEHILTKLDFSSRAQIAAWAIRRHARTPRRTHTSDNDE